MGSFMTLRYFTIKMCLIFSFFKFYAGTVCSDCGTVSFNLTNNLFIFKKPNFLFFSRRSRIKQHDMYSGTFDNDIELPVSNPGIVCTGCTCVNGFLVFELVNVL